MYVTINSTGEVHRSNNNLPEVGGNGMSTIKLRFRTDTGPGQYLFTVIGSDDREASAIFALLDPGE